MRTSVRLASLLLALSLAVAPLSAQFGGGNSVAVHSNQVLVAATGGPITTGAVHVFTSTDDGWTETDQIVPADGEPGMGFGSWMAVAGDRMLVGANSATFVFERSDDAWVEVASFANENPVYGGAISGDVAVLTGTMAYRRVPPGPVRVLTRAASGAWSEADGIAGPDDASDSRFGSSVAFVGNTLAIGAPFGNGSTDDAGEYTSGSGAVYLFEEGGTGWEQAGDPILIPGAPAQTGFGAGLHAIVGPDGPHLFVSALGGGAAGSASAYEFRHDPESGEWEPVTGYGSPIVGPRQGMPSFDGPAVAAVGDEIWIGGLSGGAAGEGQILRIGAGADGSRAFMGTVEATRGGGFGGAISVEADVAAITSPARDNGEGVVHIFEQSGGEWIEVDEVFIETPNYEAVRGAVGCSDGAAGVFGCSDVDVLSFVPVRELGAERGIRVNDVWGWTDPESDREYALVGLTNQASFVDITDPEAPRYLGRLPMPEGANASVWRDIKVYENHAYIVADGAGPHGMQVFDLTRLRDVGADPVEFGPDAHYTNIASAHNIVINEATGFAYSVGGRQGGETCGGGLHMIDIRDPKNPTFAGCFADEGTGRSGTGTSHDAMCITYAGPDEDYTGHEICFGSNETAISIADVTDKSNPVSIATAAYPNVAYAHQGWITDDHRYFYLGDEIDELNQLNSGNPFPGTRTLIWDVTDLDDPVLVDEYFGETEAIDHNMYVVGDLLYQSNYSNGLRILDISDPENPEEVGYLDTVPYNDGTSMSGSWSNYPYFRSGTIIVTSGSEGLFMVRYRKPIT